MKEWQHRWRQTILFGGRAISGTEHAAPSLTARTTVRQWCATWIDGYATRRASTVRQAKVHLAQIEAEFGSMQLAAVRPSHVRSWTARLKAEGKADSYV